MGVVTVVHTGVGLWIERDTGFELLFPKAENCPHPDASGRMLMAHDPCLYVPVAHRIDGTLSAYDLRGCTLDLRTGTGNIAGASVKQASMFPLAVEAGAPAGDEAGAFTTHRDRVSARVRLPKGLLSPAEYPLGGPLSFAGKSNVLVAFSVAFSATFSGQELHATVVNEASKLTETFVLKPDQQGCITLKLESLSLIDRQTGADAGPPVDKDFDFAANYLLTKKDVPKPPIDVPEQPAPAVAKGASGNVSILTRPPQHFCLVAYAT